MGRVVLGIVSGFAEYCVFILLLSLGVNAQRNYGFRIIVFFGAGRVVLGIVSVVPWHNKKTKNRDRSEM